MSKDYRQLMSDTIRFLAADMVQAANSGHPGAPMGMADLVTVLCEKITHNPKDPRWLNRDRLVFSGGHASPLVYSFLHLTGYDVSLDDIKSFRKLGSKTPGHPEYGHTSGVEVTTGPLGQGFANAVGFAMAGKYAAKLLNSDAIEVITHKVWCLCGDGDLQEGISYEAGALAGHLGLDNLIVLFDSNSITIEGNTSISTSENIKMRFEAQGWRVLECDGHNFDALDKTLDEAKESCGKPTLVVVTTKMAKGAATMEGSHHAHGAPLGEQEIVKSKENAGFSTEKFYIPEDALVRFRCALEKGDLAQREWNYKLQTSPDIERNALLKRLQEQDFSNVDWPVFEKDGATRDTNGKILNALAKASPSFIGGSADLAPSNKTELVGFGDFPNGKNIHFGIREHSMAAITNAIALYGLFTPFCSTFFVFSDYLRPSLRVAALSNIRAFYVFTHDSIGVGEDGPTHQPIEHLASLRVMPNVLTFRPADGAENIACWQMALKHNGPSTFALSRQSLPILPKAAFGETLNGGYLLVQNKDAKVTLIATGSEVALALSAAKELEKEGIGVNVASMPCVEIFEEQDKAYKNSVLQGKVVAIEASRDLGWYKYADEVIGMDGFGASGKDKDLFEKFGFSTQNVVAKVKAVI